MPELQDIQRALAAAADLMRTMRADHTLCAAAAAAAEACIRGLKAGGKIIFCGNGGSAADAQHWAGELVSRFAYDRPGLAAVALTTDTSIMTAIGNDYSYEQVFSRQLEAIGNKGDVLLAISTSGNSPNIIRVLQAARGLGIATVGFTGQGGGRMPEFCDICLRVPSSSTPRIQEGHEVLGHTLCGLIEAAMFPRESLTC